MWPQAKHLHTSAERSVSPVASLSSPELLSDLFTCSPHAAQARRTMGVWERKWWERDRRREAGRGTGWGQVMRDRGEGRERRQWARKSVEEMITRRRWEEQVERHIQSSFTGWQSQWRAGARGGRRKWKRHDLRFAKLIVPCAPLLLLIRRFDLKKIKIHANS